MRILFRFLVLIVAAAGLRAEVRIDARAPQRDWPRVEGYVNTSTRFVPPEGLAARMTSELGRAKIARVFLTLDELWDYRTDTYHYNYRIGHNRYVGDPDHFRYDWGRVTETDVLFYDYLGQFAANSEVLMLNVRRYEYEVIHSKKVSVEKYREVLKNGLRHYKQRYPNIRYIEAMNETEVKHFGGLDGKGYYTLFKAFSQAINELNDELKPAIPLELGGTASIFRGRSPEALGEEFAADPDPKKRLDFLTYHSYSDTDDEVNQFGARSRKILEPLGLNIPTFITEIGCADKNGGDHTAQIRGNLINASLVPRFLSLSAAQPGVIAFPWCLHHNPAVQLFRTIYYTQGGKLKLTPYGASMQALAKMKQRQLPVAVSLESRWLAATIDESGMAIFTTNQNPTGVQDLSLVIDNLQERFPGRSLRVQEFRIDSKHSNCLTNPEYEGGLELVRSTVAAAGDALALPAPAIESYGIVFWLIEPVR